MKVLVALFLLSVTTVSFASEETELVCLGSEGQIYEIVISDDEMAEGVDKQVHSFALDEETPVVPQMAVVKHEGSLYVLSDGEFGFVADETLENGLFADLRNGLFLECSIDEGVEPL